LGLSGVRASDVLRGVELERVEVRVPGCALRDRAEHALADVLGGLSDPVGISRAAALDHPVRNADEAAAAGPHLGQLPLGGAERLGEVVEGLLKLLAHREPVAGQVLGVEQFARRRVVDAAQRGVLGQSA
jgi:hypothetical protein